MIRVSSLTKSFDGFVAVDRLSFELKSGEVLGFIGPNGAGKSTTMKIITGFLAPTDGSVTIFDQDIWRTPLAAKRLIGYLPEGAPAYGDMTAAEFLRFIAEIRGFSKQQRSEAIDRVVAALDLETVLGKRIETLSKGFRRRVGLAQALIHDPRVLILDEPTDGLDPNQKHQVRELIRGLSKEKIIIISTHILEEVTALCSRVIVIANGRLLTDATPAQLEAHSRYHRAVTVESREPALGEKLRMLPGVQAVEEDQVNQRYTLIPVTGQEILPALNQRIASEGWAISQIYVEKGELNDVFRQLTTGEAA